MLKTIRYQLLSGLVMLGSSTVASAHFNVGDTLQTLTNLHPDHRRNRLYTVNYQQKGLIPACETIVITQLSHKRLVFLWRGRDYVMDYDRHTRSVGVSFQDSLHDYFGKSCDQEKIESLRDIDKKGLHDGVPRYNMSKYGILFALGHPPHHANPNLAANTWLYWRNKKRKMRITFNDQGLVVGIR